MSFQPISCLGTIITRCIPSRYILAVLGSISFIILYGLKVNLSMTIVYMVNPDTEADTGVSNDGTYNWDESQKGLILSSYYWGYLVSQLPAGRISEMFSAKWVIFVAVALNIIGTLLTPLIAEYAVVFLVFRTLEGIGGGFSFPATHVLLSRWAPVEERSIMSAIIYAGGALGTVLSMLFSGLIINWLNWQSVFYIMGSLPLTWCILWIWLIQDDPIKQQYITEQERTYIMKSLGNTEEKLKISVPWKEVCTSIPFLVIINTHFCNNTCWYFLLTELPTYLSNVLHFELEDITLMSSLPYLTLWIFSLLLSKCLDFGRSSNKITTTTARKISTTFATLVPAACLIAINFSSNVYVVSGLMALAVTTMGAMFTGVLTNHIDIAPEFAGTLVGISNTFATIPGIVIPIVVGEITDEGHSPERWGMVFYAIVGILLWEFVVYILFGSGEEQPWNRIDNTKTNNTTTLSEDMEKQDSDNKT